ncbi:(2Fe-2S) ferredoxin domain-containing protein [Streptomyces sp. NPDC021224]|uniref:(2Fe-2S) ferredoxin domain-containing protein n=1 Tax=unclassified Streptomyces TaxID=2593676 RepID=UPI0037A32286
MSRRTPETAPARGAAGAVCCTVTVCRGGGCCGTAKVPGLDHAAQLADLRTTLRDVATVRPANCLDTCEHANVVVVQPSAEGRRAGGRPVWLGLVNAPDATADIAAWVLSGGPGLRRALDD